MARRQITKERKAQYYAGMILTVLGVLLFLSTFLSFFWNFGNFNVDPQSGFLRAFIGIIMIASGAFLQHIGLRGLAGSGVILDPEKAREDVEPWSRMAGGIIRDAVDESGLQIGKQEDSSEEELDFDEKLRKLHKLYEDGILTEEEYQKEKQDILDKN